MTEPPTPAEVPEASRADDSGIPDEEILYRRLSYDNGDWVVRHAVTGERVRPASGAFSPDPDGVSVFRRSLLLASTPPLSARDVAMAPGELVVGFAVGDVRSIHLGVKDDLWPRDVRDPEHPRYGAHSLIIGLNGLSKNKRIRQQQALTKLPSMTFVYVPAP